MRETIENCRNKDESFKSQWPFSEIYKFNYRYQYSYCNTMTINLGKVLMGKFKVEKWINSLRHKT